MSNTKTPEPLNIEEYIQHGAINLLLKEEAIRAIIAKVNEIISYLEKEKV